MEIKELKKFLKNSNGYITTKEIESIGISKTLIPELINQKILRKVAYGIYIDNNLEAFTFGELLNPDTVVVHVEKANPEIRGLYTAINKLFLENEFPSVEFVNREEDLGIEGLRQAKLSYKPIKLVEKYTLIEK